jgi:hypothetical protein
LNILNNEISSDDFSSFMAYEPYQSSKIPLWEAVARLASINEFGLYMREASKIIPLIHKELLEVNSETRRLFGRAGDARPWIISDSNRLKLYKMAQKLADLQEGKRIRIKRKTAAKSADVYSGILRLKLSIAMIIVFADSFKKVLPLEEKFLRLHKDITFIFTSALEIDSEILKAMESNRLKNFFKSYS